LSCHRFSPFGASLDTAILSYSPVQFLGTIIHFYHCQQIIPDNYDMFADFVFSDFERHVGYIQRSNVAGQMGNFFAYKGTRIKDEPKCGIWYLYFYRSVLATVGFIKSKEPR